MGRRRARERPVVTRAGHFGDAGPGEVAIGLASVVDGLTRGLYALWSEARAALAGGSLQLLRPVAVFGLASVASVLAFELAGALGAEGDLVPTAPLTTAPARHGLDELSVLQPVLYQVEEAYIEPARVDWERMFAAALESVEKGVPVCRFRRVDRVLHVEVGELHTVIEVPIIGSRRELQLALEEVGGMIGDHLVPEDIPGHWADPYARIEYAMVNGALGTLDPHSMLLVPEEARQMDVDNDGQYGGLGISVEDRDGRMIITRVRDGDPGDRAGLLVGDHIVRVDGVSTMSMSSTRVLDRIRGVPGSEVALDVRRRGEPPQQVMAVRGVIEPDAVRASWLDGDILYLAIPTFHDRVAQGLRTALQRETLRHGTPRGVVLDLRGNPGGFVRQAVEVADTFIEDGTLLSTVAVGERREPDQRAHRAGTQPDYPLAVLLDADSASASEIVAGALRNHERAVIVGERSFGKGSVQNLWDFADGSKLKLTIGKYLTPGEISIQSVGIPADIAVRPIVVASGAEEPDLRLLWREHVLREADLDGHFDPIDERALDAAFRVDVLAQDLFDQEDDERDPATDPVVQVARRVLADARSSRRSDILGRVAPLVERVHLGEEATIAARLAALGVDWSDGGATASAVLGVNLEPVGGPLQAGEPHRLRLTVSNGGESDLHRVVVVTRADIPGLDRREWVLGALPARGERSAEHLVELPVGFGAAELPVSVEVVDGGGPIASLRSELRVEAAPMPDLRWSWSWHDEGDGDGVVERGERWRMQVELRNEGTGPTEAPYVQLTSELGSGVEMLVGATHPGEPMRRDGTVCEVLTPGWDGLQFVGGEPAGEPGFDPVEYEPDCLKRILPGQTAKAQLALQIVDIPAEGAALELQVGDGLAYDHVAAVEQGLWGLLGGRTSLLLRDGRTVNDGQAHPPQIDLSQAPPLSTAERTLTVSGLARDDRGLAHVQVFVDDDKAFVDASPHVGAPLRAVPFTATVQLEPGVHRVVVVATDRDGLSQTRSQRVWVREEGRTASR